MLALATVAALLAAPPQKTVAAGMEYRGADGPAETRLEPFVYPDVYYRADYAAASLEVNSAMPVLVPDLIGAAVSFLSGGPDHIPLWHALNGDREPCAVNIADGTAAMLVGLDSRSAFEVGVRGHFRFVSVLFPEEDGGDGRISLQPATLASSIGLRARLPVGLEMRSAVHAGNGFTRFSAWNPTAGIDVRASVPLGRSFAFEVAGGYSAQQLDLSGYREPVSGERYAGTAWYGFWSADARLAYRWAPR